MVGHQVPTFIPQCADSLTVRLCPSAHLDMHSLLVGPKYAGGEHADRVLLQQLRVLPLNGGTLLLEGLRSEADSETATLEWLVTALDYARSKGQTKVVGYLEEVADDVVFEVEMVARRTSLVGKRMPFSDNREHLAQRGPDHPVEPRPLRV